MAKGRGGKAKAKGAARGSTKIRSAQAGSATRPPHPLMVQADITPEQRARFAHEVAALPNPHGEVVQAGRIKGHQGVRRVPGWRVIAGRPGVSTDVIEVLAKLAEWLDTAEAGIVKSGLDFTGGGSAASYVPFSEVRVFARDQAEWALGFLRPVERMLVTRLLTSNVGFADVAGELWPRMNRDWAARKASGLFVIAANTLLANCGSRWLGIR